MINTIYQTYYLQNKLDRSVSLRNKLALPILLIQIHDCKYLYEFLQQASLCANSPTQT